MQDVGRAIGYLILCGIPLGILVAISIANSREADRRRKALAEARDAYHGALAELKAAPSNPDVKQRTLDFGRTYSNLTRQSKGVTVYDEMALANDISAATAGATAAAVPATVQERLTRLDELRASGTITEAEHAARRQKIVEEL